MSDVSGMEGRLRALENKLWLAYGGAAVIAIWLGVTSIWVIPKLVNETAAGKANDEIQALLAQARKSAEQVNHLGQDGTVTIGGTCFRPHDLVRCSRSRSDHMTWVDNAKECTDAGMTVESTIPALTRC